MKKISWNEPKFGKKELELVKEVLDSGYCTEGPKTKELEEKLAKIVRTKHVIMTTSATSALYLAIEADKRIKGYTQGTVVIPNLTFIATKNAVELANLKVEIKDVYCNNYLLHHYIYCSPKPRIVIPVNILGRSVDTNWFNFSQPKSTIICDNAGCLGSNVYNGDVGCYSLQANKLLTCGQGGFCATDSDEYAKVIRQLKDFGREDKEDQDTLGFNFKFNDIQAAVVLGQLTQLNKRKKLQLEQYKHYKVNLKNSGDLVDYDLDIGELPLWMEFTCSSETERDCLYDSLKEKGIQSRKPWACLIKDYELYPNSMFYQDHILWLPNGPTLNRKQQDYIIKCIKGFYGV